MSATKCWKCGRVHFRGGFCDACGGALETATLGEVAEWWRKLSGEPPPTLEQWAHALQMRS